MPAHPSLRLDSDWLPGAGDPGRITLVLRNLGDRPMADFHLAFTSQFRIKPGSEIKGGFLIEQVSNHHVVAPPAGLVLAPGDAWTISADRLGQRPAHYTYGPKSAYVVLGDGALATVEVTPMTREGKAGSPLIKATRPPHRAEEALPWALIPFPTSAETSGRRNPGHSLSLAAGTEPAQAAFNAVAALSERLFPDAPSLFGGSGGIACSARHEAMPEEAYRIGFTAERVTVSAGGNAGFVYAFITLAQLLRGARQAPEAFAFPQDGEIRDNPRFAWRGMMLDVARQVFSVDSLAVLIDCLAWLKLNRFHLHLTDDEGWRLDIPGYPEVAALAAWQGHGLPIPPLLGSPPTRHGMVYSRADLAGLVEQAGALGVTIVPEIDIPGHCYALLQALPSLRDPGENGLYHSIQSFPNNCLNPGVEAVYPALEKILGELCELFPSKYFHVGADEVPADAWSSSPAARALGKDGAAPLQALFLQRIQAFLTTKGKITGGWEEAAQGGGIDKTNCYLVGWHTVEASQKLAAEGYRVVVAPGQAYYLDMANGEDWHEAGAGWAGWASPEKTYKFEPSAGWNAAEREKLMGVQACIWSEPMTDRAVFDRLVFPRLSAIAETGWTPADKRDWTRFEALAGLMPNLYGFMEQTGG